MESAALQGKFFLWGFSLAQAETPDATSRHTRWKGLTVTFIYFTQYSGLTKIARPRFKLRAFQ